MSRNTLYIPRDVPQALLGLINVRYRIDKDSFEFMEERTGFTHELSAARMNETAYSQVASAERDFAHVCIKVRDDFFLSSLQAPARRPVEQQKQYLLLLT